MPEAVLTFHGVGDPERALDVGEERVWLTRERFEAILDALTGLDVQLTFDDANASDREIALPALLGRSRQATFFVVTRRLDEDHFLTTEDVVRLVEAGMRVGIHGAAHVDWRSLPTPDLRAQIREAKNDLESIVGSTVDTASCPFGSYDRRVLGTLRELEIRRVFTSDPGRSRADAWLRRRTTVQREMAPLDVRRLATHGPGRARAFYLDSKHLLKRFR